MAVANYRYWSGIDNLFFRVPVQLQSEVSRGAAVVSRKIGKTEKGLPDILFLSLNAIVRPSFRNRHISRKILYCHLAHVYQLCMTGRFAILHRMATKKNRKREIKGTKKKRATHFVAAIVTAAAKLKF
jgi:hypothetical protein